MRISPLQTSPSSTWIGRWVGWFSDRYNVSVLHLFSDRCNVSVLRLFSDRYNVSVLHLFSTFVTLSPCVLVRCLSVETLDSTVILYCCMYCWNFGVGKPMIVPWSFCCVQWNTVRFPSTLYYSRTIRYWLLWYIERCLCSLHQRKWACISKVCRGDFVHSASWVISTSAELLVYEVLGRQRCFIFASKW